MTHAPARPSRLRTGAAALALSASLGWASPAAAFLDTEKAWNDLLQFAVRQANTPGEFEIELGRVTRPDDGFARIESLSLRDGDGEWLSAAGLVIDWSPSSLLRGRFTFDVLSAESITVDRGPIPRGDPPGDEPGIDAAWPRSPVALQIGELNIDRLTISDKLAPQTLVASVKGSFLDRGDEQNAALTLTRLSGPEGVIDFSSSINFDDGTAVVTLDAREGPGGLVAAVAGIPETEPVEMTIKADGTFQELPFTLDGRIGEIGAATGSGVLGWRQALRVAFDGELRPDEKAAPRWRQALGEAATLNIKAEQTPEGTVEIETFALESPILGATGGGTVSPGEDSIDIRFDFAARDVEAFAAVIEPTRFDALSGSAVATGRLSAPNARIEAQVSGLRGDFGRVEQAVFDLRADPQGGAQSPLDFTLSAAATGLAPTDPALARALGPAPQLTARGVYDAPGQSAAVSALSLSTEAVSLEGSAAYDLAGGLVDATLTGTAARLEPITRLAGLTLDGAARFDLDVSRANLKTGFVERASVDAALTGLETPDPALAAVLGDRADLDVTLVGGAAGVMTLETASLTSRSLSATGAGTIDTTTEVLDLALDWRVLDPAAISRLIGAAEFTAAEGQATVGGTIPEPALTVAARVDELRAGDAAAGSARLTAGVVQRKDRRAPFTLDAALERVTTGDPVLDDLIGRDVTLAGGGIYDLATRRLTLDAATLEAATVAAQVSGSVDLAERLVDVGGTAQAPDLAAFSAIAGADLGGAAEIRLGIAGSLDTPDITATAEIDRPRYDAYAARSATLRAKAGLYANGDLPFDATLDLRAPDLGDPALEAALGDEPTLTANGRYDRSTRRLLLERARLSAASGTAALAGSVDLEARELDLTFETDAPDLARLSRLAGAELGGSFAARGALRGGFATPTITLDADGEEIRYGDYTIELFGLEAEATAREDRRIPFDVTARVSGPGLDDPGLRAALGGSPLVRARGLYDQQNRVLDLDSARAQTALGDLDASGEIDLAGRTLDLLVEADLDDLEPLSQLAGAPLAGSGRATIAVDGAFEAPAVDADADLRGFEYGDYRIGTADLTAKVRPDDNGVLEFDATLDAGDPDLGDPALAALIGNKATLRAAGRFDPQARFLRLRRADLTAAIGEIEASGTVDLADQVLDLSADAALPDLGALSALAGAPMDGSGQASIRATGAFAAPKLDVTATLSDPAYGTYGADAVSLRASTRPRQGGALAFDATVDVSRPALGDPALEALIGPEADITASGTLDSASRRLTLDSAAVDLAAAQATAKGTLDLGARRLDLMADARIDDLGTLAGLAGAPMGGSGRASIRATGALDAPELDVSATLADVAYDTYRAEAVTLDARTSPGAGGALAFDATLDARGPRMGDPALEALIGPRAGIRAKGTFDVAAQRLTLDSAAVDLAAARATAAGSVDLGAKTLDLTADARIDDLGALSGLAGVPLGGAATADIRARGAFAAPELDFTVRADNPLYDRYGARALVLSGQASPGAGGALAFDATATVEGPSTGDPSLDALIGPRAAIAARGSFDASARRLSLDAASADLAGAQATASGTVDLGAKTLDLAAAARVDDLGALSGLAGVPLSGALTADIRASGPFSAPVLDVDARAAPLGYDRYSAASVALRARTVQAGQGLGFDVALDVGGPSTGDPALDALLGPAPRITAQGVYDPASQRLTLSPAMAQLAAATATVDGAVDLAARAFDLSYRADIADLGALSGLAGKPLSGAAVLEGRAGGPFADPGASGVLNGSAIAYDGRPVGDVTARYDLATLVSAPTGDVSLQANTPYGPVEASARIASSGGVITVDPVSVNGLGLGARGRVSLLPGGLIDGALDLSADDLATIGALAGLDLSGSLQAQAQLTPQGGQQGISARGRVDGLRAAQNGAVLATVGSLAFEAQVDDALGADPRVAATLDLNEAAAASVSLTTARARLGGALSALDIALTGAGDLSGAGRDNDTIDLAATARLRGGPIAVTARKLEASVRGVPILLRRELTAAQTADGGWAVENIGLTIADGAIVGRALWAPSGAAATLVIRDMPLTLTALAGADIFGSGRLDADIDMDARRGAGGFTIEVNNISLRDAPLDQPIRVTAEGTWTGGVLTASARGVSNAFATPIVAEARVPLLPAAGSPLPRPDPNAAFEARVSWSGEVGEVWPLVPAPGHLLYGSIDVSAQATGSIANPNFFGGMTLSNGRYESLDFGTQIVNLNARADFTREGRLNIDARGDDGLGGSISVGGFYVVPSRQADIRLTSTRMALARRDDLFAQISGEASVLSEGGGAINVRARMASDFAEFRLIGGGAPTLIVIDAVPVGASAPPPPPEKDNSGAQRILLDVVLTIPREAYARGRGLESEWGGRIAVSGSAAEPTVAGIIAQRRGWFDLIGRRFDLETGEVRFTGDLDPLLNIRLQREANEITGWIDITGSASDPQVAFGSKEGLPDDEVLPRLLFGRSKQSLSAFEAAQLAAGVATLMSGKAGALDFARDLVGVDSLRLDTDASGGATISTGKYVADGVFVGAKNNIDNGKTSAIVEIETFKNVTIDAELGADETKAGVSWKRDY